MSVHVEIRDFSWLERPRHVRNNIKDFILSYSVAVWSAYKEGQSMSEVELNMTANLEFYGVVD